MLGLFHKALEGSLLTNQYFMEAVSECFFCVAQVILCLILAEVVLLGDAEVGEGSKLSVDGMVDPSFDEGYGG